MTRKPGSLIVLATSAVVAICAAMLHPAFAQSSSGAPKYEVDQSWPKPLPDRWVLGGLGGVCVDPQDHVFLLNRQDIVEES